MKRSSLSVLTSLLLTSTVMAADLPSQRQTSPAYIPPVFTWTGFYVGANAGYAWNGNSKLRDIGYHNSDSFGSYANGWFTSERHSDDGSFVGGVQVGYNYQIGNAVLGIEADVNYSDLKKNYYAADSTDLNGGGNYNYHLREYLNIKNKIEWFGTIRPRLGFTPIDRLLVYATGGLAYGRVKNDGVYNWREYGFWWGGPGDHNFDRSGGFDGSKSQTRWGWTVGAGLEYAVTENITVKGEYLYVDLGNKRRTISNPVDSNEFITWKDTAKFHVVRAGLNYKF